MRQRHLAMQLSSLHPHPCHSVELEQYPTEGNLAAAWLTKIDLGDGFAGKHILDLGAGNGVLGIGAAFLGAEHVTMVECDADTVEVLQQNVKHVEGEATSRDENVESRERKVKIRSGELEINTTRADKAFESQDGG